MICELAYTNIPKDGSIFSDLSLVLFLLLFFSDYPNNHLSFYLPQNLKQKGSRNFIFILIGIFEVI